MKTKTIHIPMHGGQVMFRTTTKGKGTNIDFDLWHISYDITKKAAEEIVKDYEEYFRNQSILKSTGYYSGRPKSCLFFRVASSDAIEWGNKLLHFLEDIKNLEPIKL
jgi:hypothetical protein